MPTKYLIIEGDTYDTIARKVYGDDQQSGRIRRANPGATDPLIAGTSLTIPDNVVFEDQGIRTASTSNEVAIRIEGVRFRFWSSVVINLALDAVSTIDFTAPFEPDNTDFREIFRPFSYKAIDIDVGGVRLFSGTIMDIVPSMSIDSRTVSVSCYALPGVTGDCTAPASAYPIEWDAINLQTIAENVTDFFGLTIVFDGDAGPVFERSTLSPGEKVLPWLANLAAQRGFVISSTAEGALFFTKSITEGTPVANLIEGISPVVSIMPAFKSQEYYSDITGVTPVLVGLEGPQYTEKNKHLPNAIRPHTFTSNDTFGADLPEAVRSKIGRMFANAINYELFVATWRDPSGNLWKPNTLITLDAPGAMIYGKSTFLIRSVTLQKTDSKESATLSLVLPDAFAGKVPETLPWDE